MRIHVVLRVPVESKSLCLSVLEALEPDNTTAPKGVSISAYCDDETFVAQVYSEDVAVLTTRNTVDDILVHVNLALTTISLIDKDGESMNAFKLPRIND